MLNITHQFNSVAQSRLGCHVLHQCMKVKSESEVKKKKEEEIFFFLGRNSKNNGNLVVAWVCSRVQPQKLFHVYSRAWN